MGEVVRRAAMACAGAVIVAALSAGCGGEQLAEQMAEGAINGEVDLEDDSISITDDEGNEFSAGTGTEIPQTWPADVPMYPSGTLVLATTQSDGTATALWETTAPVDSAANDYDAVLLANGFSMDQDAMIAGAIVRTYSGTLHTVNVTVAETDGSTNVNVAVVPN